MDEKLSNSRQTLKQLQEAITKILREGEPTFSWYLTIRDENTGLIIHAGAGCAPCMVVHSVKWLMENRIPHDSDCPAAPTTEDETKH